MTAPLALSAVNAAADLLVAVAIGVLYLTRRDAFTRYLALAFVVWFVNDMADVLISEGILPISVTFLFYNLSTLHSAFFLLAVTHLRRAEGDRRWGPGGLWRSDWLNPVTVAAGVVLVLTLGLHFGLPESRVFAVPDLLFATVMWVAMGWAVYRFLAPSDLAVALMALFTFAVLTALVVGYLAAELELLDPAAWYLPFKLAAVLAHLLIIYIISHVVARGLWRELVAEQQNLSQLIESSPSAILVVAEDGTVERINSPGRGVLGLPPPRDGDEAEIPRITELLPGVAWAPGSVADVDVGGVLAEHAVVPGDDDDVDQHLRVYIARLSTHPETGARWRQRRYVLIAIDIADELERERVAMEAERAKTLSVLSGGTIHHFHNKLLAIRTGLRFLQTRMSVERARDLRLSRLVRATDQAFTLSQQLAGSIRMARASEYEVIDVGAVLHQAVSDIEERRPPAYTVEVADETGRPPDDPVLVRGMAGFLKMVFENLATNAFDAVRAGESGRLHIRLSLSGEEQGGVRIFLEDDGMGVPDAVRHQIFVPFFTTKEDAGGTGFGLYWSRRLIEAMGGHLNLEWTEVGCGSRFVLDLPLAPGREPAAGGENGGGAKEEST